MKRFKNILAVYGEELGADNVFRDSIALAKANNARLTLIDVLHDRFTSQAEIEERRKRLMRLVPAVHAEGPQHFAAYGARLPRSCDRLPLRLPMLFWVLASFFLLLCAAFRQALVCLFRN